MEQNGCSIKVKLLNSSIQESEQITIVCQNLKLADHNSCSVNIAKVDDDYSEFAVEYGMPIQVVDDELKITSPADFSFQPGMYMLSRIKFFKDIPEGPTNELSLTPQDFGICLFQVYQENDEILSEQELTVKYNNILVAREHEFTSGFGGDSNQPNMSKYIGLFFLKNCLITRRMRLGRYEIIPFEGLNYNG